MNDYGDKYKMIKGIDKLENYIIDQLVKHDRCLVAGTVDMINQFTHDFGTRIDIVMLDVSTLDGHIISEPMKVFDKKSKDILLLGIVDKAAMIDVITCGMTINVDSSKDIVIVELKKDKHGDSYVFTTSSKCARTQEEKIEMISDIFHVPDKETIDEMEITRKLAEGEFILEVDNPRIAEDTMSTDPIKSQDILRNKTFYDALNIDEIRCEELANISIKLFGESINREKLSGEDIWNSDHELFLNLLEKEEGMRDIEKLYLTFNHGRTMQEVSTKFGKKFEHMENDTDDRIKQIGEKYSHEMTKSDTVIKIENLDNLSLREKLKACFWSGVFNQKICL